MVDFFAGWSNLGLIYALNSFLFWFLSGLLFMSFQWLEERGHNIACYKSFQNFLERHHRWVLSSLFCMDLSLFTLFFSSMCNHQMLLLFYLIECTYIWCIRTRGQWMEKALPGLILWWKQWWISLLGGLIWVWFMPSIPSFYGSFLACYSCCCNGWKKEDTIQLVTNHSKVSLKDTIDEFFHHYFVWIYPCLLCFLVPCVTIRCHCSFI